MKEDMNKLRRPRRRRPRRPKRFVLTQRDVDYLVFTARMGCATVDSIQDLSFGAWPSHAQRRVALAFEHRYLNKLHNRAVNQHDVYYVSPSATRGWPLVEEALTALDRNPAPLPPPNRLDEALMMTRLAARLWRACRDGGFAMADWRSERELRGGPALGRLVPDAYCRIARSIEPSAKGASFFLELERSDKAIAYWDEKFRRYVELYDSGRYERAFGVRSLRILVVLAAGGSNAARLRRLNSAAERQRATMVRLAEWQPLRAAPAADVLRGALWKQPGRDEPVSLF